MRKLGRARPGSWNEPGLLGGIKYVGLCVMGLWLWSSPCSGVKKSSGHQLPLHLLGSYCSNCRGGEYQEPSWPRLFVSRCLYNTLSFFCLCAVSESYLLFPLSDFSLFSAFSVIFAFLSLLSGHVFSFLSHEYL